MPAYKGCLDVTGIIGNMVLVNSGLPHVKEFLQKLSAIWAHALKNVHQPCSQLKLKEYWFECVPNY